MLASFPVIQLLRLHSGPQKSQKIQVDLADRLDYEKRTKGRSQGREKEATAQGSKLKIPDLWPWNGYSLFYLAFSCLRAE